MPDRKEPNDEPKVSPSVMKAADALHETFDFYSADTAKVVDDATNITAKEAALLRLVEVIDFILNPTSPDGTFTSEELRSVFNEPVAQAKNVLKP